MKENCEKTTCVREERISRGRGSKMDGERDLAVSSATGLIILRLNEPEMRPEEKRRGAISFLIPDGVNFIKKRAKKGRD